MLAADPATFLIEKHQRVSKTFAPLGRGSRREVENGEFCEREKEPL
jgi:hypothetical protein